MNLAVAPLDHVLVALLVLLSLVEWRWVWPRWVRAVAAGVPGARSGLYRFILIAEWAFTAVVLGWWAIAGRPWTDLRLGPGTPWRLAIGLAVTAAYVALTVAQRRALLARPERLARLMRRVAHVDPLFPATPAEHRQGMAVSITAGLCEELIYRGFVLWYANVLGGPVVAVIASSLVFGLGHLYQGGSHVLRTGALGVVFALLALGTDSLWPGIVVHAVADMVGLDLGYHGRLVPPIPDPAPAAGAA